MRAEMSLEFLWKYANSIFMDEVSVNLEFTPNPDSLKYVVNRSLLAKGAKNFSTAGEAQKFSGLAANLFELKGVTQVLIGTNFVSINFSDQDDLQSLNELCTQKIKDYLLSGRPILEPSSQSETAKPALSEIESKICDVLDKEVRPAVAMDGGDIVFEKYEDGYVYIKMQGSCSGCPSSLMTLKMGVESRLKEAIPEIVEVIPV